ncbi:MAG: ATP-binding protein [Clostridia bacterium]|nr:ATP-binding protein [Clostridia bacterium]
MIRKLVRQMLLAQTFSALTVSLCLMIDSIMIGRFLGKPALASYGLANPVLLISGAIGSLLAAGIQVCCGRSIGLGSKEETDRAYSSAAALAAGISLVFMLLVLLLASPLSRLLGAAKSDTLFKETKGYMRGFIIGAPAMMASLVLVPFLQMAGQSRLLIIAVLGMTVSDVGLDLLNALVLKWDMFGMGLASSLSYYIATAIALIYFLSKKCVFRFSFKLISRKKIIELFKEGLPAGFNLASGVVLVAVVNKMLTSVGTDAGAVAAFSVINTIGNAACCVNTGIGGVSLTLSGILYNEEDRAGLISLMKQLFMYSAVLGLGMAAVLVIGAPAFASAFITTGGDTLGMAVKGIRLYSAGLMFCCANNALKNMYQATGKPHLTECISTLEGALLPSLAALFLGFLPRNIDGFWYFFVVGETVTLMLILLHAALRQKRSPVKNGAYLLLNGDFGAPAERLLEASISSLDEVSELSQRAEEFCIKNGQSVRVSRHIALCIEEVASNVISHGFTHDNKPHNLSVRVLGKPDHWVLRFRDDCRAFDPISYLTDHPETPGIKLMLALAEDAKYTYSLSMNNLTLTLKGDCQA